MVECIDPPIKVLVAAHIGKPWGGISTLFEDILHSSLKNKFDLIFFESSINQQKSGTGEPSGRAIFHSIISICVFSYKVIKNQPQIVHIATAHKGSFIKHGIMVFIAKILGRKIILAPHCSISVLLPEHSSKIWEYWVKLVFAQSDCVLVLSKEWLAHTSLLPLNKIQYLPNAINTQKFSFIHRIVPKNSKSTNIVFLGHISTEKGLLNLVEAINILIQNGIVNISVELVGEAIKHQEFEEITQMINAYGISSYINIRKPEFGLDKIERLSLADIFVLPSLHEGMPITILEAFAAGLPIVATSVGGIPDLVINGVNGFLVPPGSSLELAEALKELIQNPSLRLQIGNINREKAHQSYDIEKYANKLGEIYQTMANK